MKPINRKAETFLTQQSEKETKTTIVRLDKSVFKVKSFAEADDNRSYWMSVSPKTRLAAAWYLICSAYNLEYHGNHKMDKKKFTIRRLGE